MKISDIQLISERLNELNALRAKIWIQYKESNMEDRQIYDAHCKVCKGIEKLEHELKVLQTIKENSQIKHGYFDDSRVKFRGRNDQVNFTDDITSVEMEDGKVFNIIFFWTSRNSNGFLFAEKGKPVTVKLPKDMIGKAVGRGAENIRRLSAIHGAKITIEEE